MFFSFKSFGGGLPFFVFLMGSLLEFQMLILIVFELMFLIFLVDVKVGNWNRNNSFCGGIDFWCDMICSGSRVMYSSVFRCGGFKAMAIGQK